MIAEQQFNPILHGVTMIAFVHGGSKFTPLVTSLCAIAPFGAHL